MKTESVKGNKTNICSGCKNEIPTCKPEFLIFGDGVGSDNVVGCDIFEARRILYINESYSDEIFDANPDFEGAVMYSEIREVHGKKYICFNGEDMSGIWKKGDFYMDYGDFKQVPDSWDMEDLRGSDVIYRPLRNTP